MAEVNLLGFMPICKRLVKQALGKDSGECTETERRWMSVIGDVKTG
jgi:hypothetical protein